MREARPPPSEHAESRVSGFGSKVSPSCRPYAWSSGGMSPADQTPEAEKKGML